MNLWTKTIYAQLRKQWLFSLLNIVGIAISISACWVIYRIVSFEYSFDSKLPDRANIYRMVTGLIFDEKESYSGGVSAPMYRALREEIPGLKRVVPVFGQWISTVEVVSPGLPTVMMDDPKGIVATDSTYFAMVPYTWLAGSPATSLNAPESVVLTESRAKSYFGTLAPEAILGKVITYNKEKKRTVTGVVKDLQYPTEFTAREFFRLPAITYALSDWTNTNGTDQVYLQLSPDADTARVLAQATRIAAAKWDENARQNKLPNSVKRWFKLLPLADSHFSDYIKEWQVRKASKPVMHGLISSGLLLIIVACINFINLTTAQLPQRAMSIGVRKVLGSSSSHLVKTIMGETLLIVLLALTLAFPLTRLAYLFLGDIVPQGMFDYYAGWRIVIFLAVVLIGVTLLSGGYPAWLVTKIKAIGIIQGHDALNTQGGNRMALRKVLIVFQFVIAQVFIAGALIMGVQLSYTLKKDLGFNKEAVVLLDVPWKIQRNPAYKDKHFVLSEVLKNETGIAMVSVGREPLADNTSSSMYEYYSGKQQEPVRRQVYKKWVDTSYIHVYNMQLLAGRNLRLSDTTNEFLINETAMKAFGFASPQDAIGKTIGQLFGPRFPIVGVVKDFHVRDFHTTIDPVALMANKEGANNISIRLSGNNPAKWQATLKKVEGKWHQMYPSEEWNGRFYDQTLAAMYKQERDQSKLVNLSTAIAIVISSLGLFGLALLIAFQRTKEIGIRKVLGASVAGIVQMLMSDFGKLILVAFLIACPIAWWIMYQWLQDFAYRIEIEWWMFALSGTTIVSIAMLTVGFLAVRAALVNPAMSLRTV